MVRTYFFIPLTYSQGKKGKGEAEALPAPSKEVEFYRQLEQNRHCAEHDRACFVLSDGNHYHLTPNDIGKWAHLVVRLR